MSFDVIFRYRQSPDPSLESPFAGPGCYWLDTTTEPYILKLRNEDDDDWIQIGASPDVYTDEMVRDVMGTALTAGSGITITPNDGADTITVASTITQYTDEMARDALGSALTDSSTIDVTPNDGGDTISLAVINDAHTHDTQYYGQTAIDAMFGNILDQPEFTNLFDTGGDPVSFTQLSAAGTTADITGSSGNGICGIIELEPGGTGITSGSQVRVDLDTARLDTNYAVFFMPMSSAAVTLGGVSATSRSTTSFTLRLASAPTTGTTYQWFYLVIGY